MPTNQKSQKAPILRDLPDELVGQRIIVRPLRPGDGPAVWEAIDESRERLQEWMPWAAAHATPEDSEATVRRAHIRWLAREDLMVGIWHRATGRYLGGSGLHEVNWDVPSFTIGYWVRTSEEGKGYITETVRLLCTLAFEGLGANRVYLTCDPKNTRSAAVARRVGFEQEGILRNAARTTVGELRDTAMFAMTPTGYEAAPWRTIP